MSADLFPEGNGTPPEASLNELQGRFGRLETRVEALEHGGRELPERMEKQIADLRTYLVELVDRGINQMNLIALGMQQKAPQSVENDAALVSLCEETLEAIRGHFQKGVS